MLLKLSAILVLLGTASLGEPSARGLCPKFCKCTYSGSNQGIARCSTLDPEVQNVFPQNIRHLVVENDPNPKNITNSMFLTLGLKKLSTIKIVNSSVMSLDVGAFNGLNQLRDVNLADNRLMLIHPDTFKNNTELKRLVLSSNPIQLTQVLPAIGEYVLRSDSLNELYLSKCGMNQLSNRAFSELGNLDVLDLSENSIRHIDPDVFIGLDQLEVLDLSSNELLTIPSDTFERIDSLTTLKLNGNPLQTFDLPNVSELKELDLSQSQFTYLGPVTFEGVSELNSLNLSYNAIDKIDPDAFEVLVDLRYLDLSYNELKGPLHKFLLEPITNLETITLAGNKNLKVLDEFNGEFSNLYFYDISDCGLSSLNYKMFKRMYYLATLNASNNEIEKIDFNAFSGLPHLNILDLSGNRIEFLHLNTFSSNRELTKLYLSGNLINHIPTMVFRPLVNLNSLDLSYNMLTSVFNHSESLILQTKNILGSVTHLNLAGNYIKHLHIFSFISMVKLEVLDISDNQIECTANFNKVVKWLAAHRIFPNMDQLSHPVSMILDDKIENYKRWMTMLDLICPVNLKDFEEITSKAPHIDNTLDDLDEPRIEPVRLNSINMNEDNVEDTNDFYYSKHMKVNEGSRYEMLEMANDPSEWPTLMLITVFCVFIFVAFINVGVIMFFRARRNYSLVGYKSTFSGSSMPQTRFPLRKGQRNAYQKLYEECSVPNTPIVKNGNKLNIISIFGSHTNVSPQQV